MTTVLGLLFFQRRQREYDRHAAGYVAKLSETVSGLQRAEKASRESEGRFRSIVDTASDGILIARSSTRKFVEANVAICEMLGYTRDELLRLGVENIHPASDLSFVSEDFNKLSRAEKRTPPLEGVPMMRKDGSVFYADINANPVEFEGEQCLAGIFRDITVRKRAEEEREHLHAQLHQAMKMEAVGRLAGGVAHDFNNLLTVINGYSELLLQRLGENSPMRKDVEEILQAGNQAGALTRQLLVFSRKQVLQPKVIDLNMVVSKTGKMLRRLIGENIEFRTILAEGLGRVKADEGQVEQILLNLAINARDAMPGGGELTIETANVVLGETFAKDHPSLIPGPHVLLSVGDTGSGIPDEIRGHIFEPFFTTKGLGKGTGLGLATVYGIIQQSQGHLGFDTEAGKGTTFRIYLPRVDAESEALSTVPTAAPQGSETVLVVEDEDSVREIINRVLSGKGYRVLMASDGSEGLRVSAEYNGPIDLLLTDLVMPGMGGREFATRLEAGRAGMKVLFMSGYTEDVISHQGLLEAGLSFLQKPFTSGDLLRKVREVLGP
jgi:PAS domain S-box-containing protein